MNDVWQLRVKQHRILGFLVHDQTLKQYIMTQRLSRKATKKTPPARMLHRAEALIAEIVLKQEAWKMTRQYDRLRLDSAHPYGWKTSNTMNGIRV